MELLASRADVEWLALGGLPRQEAGHRLDARLVDADALLVSPWQQFPGTLTSERLDRFPELKVIAGTFDNRFAAWVDVQELSRRGIVLVDTSRNMTPTVAEFAFAMTLNLLRDIPAALDVARNGGWQAREYSCAPRKDGFVYGDLAGRRIAFAGFGSINRRYAQFARAFGCEMTACDPFVPDAVLGSHGVRRVASLVELAADSEIFMIGIPPTPATLGIISAEVINALPAGSLFILVTRMAVVEQKSLWERIQRNELRAAIDVFDPEPPPPGAWFRKHPNCLCSPHIAGGVFYCHERCFVAACRDALAVLEGRTPEYAATTWDAEMYAGRLASEPADDIRA
jgi:phosphoglycerate dehydrogenase-like enzyme